MTFQCPKCAGDLFFLPCTECAAAAGHAHYECEKCRTQFVVQDHGTHLEMWETVSPTEIRVSLQAIAERVPWPTERRKKC